jgi:hypothetical protein
LKRHTRTKILSFSVGLLREPSIFDFTLGQIEFFFWIKIKQIWLAAYFARHQSGHLYFFEEGHLANFITLYMATKVTLHRQNISRNCHVIIRIYRIFSESRDFQIYFFYNNNFIFLLGNIKK